MDMTTLFFRFLSLTIGNLLAITSRGDSNRANEGASHQIRASETAIHRNLINTFLGLGELASRSFDTQLRNIARRRASYFACEHALEVSDTHGDAFGQ